MASATSQLMLAAIVLLAFDISLLGAFIAYFAYKWYCSSTRPQQPEHQTINYDEAFNVKTQTISLTLDENGFQIPDTDSHAFLPESDKKKHLWNNSSARPVDFDISMYFPDAVGNEEADVFDPPETQPTLLFSFFYNISLIELTVVLARGKRFSTKQINPESSDHVLVSVVLLPEGTIYHSSRGVPPNPHFKDRFTFCLSPEELRASSVKFNVWKIDKYSRRSPYGETVINLSDAFGENDSLFAGSVQMWRELNLTDTLTHETKNGEILSTLQYLPGAERVNITIVKGRDLKLEEFDKDLYVKVSAILNEKVIKNKKTSIMRKTPTPLFNETTSFQLHPHTSLTLDNMSIVMSVYAYRSRGPHRRLIARAVVGSTDVASETGKEHWRKMVDGPHKMVANWQELR